MCVTRESRDALSRASFFLEKAKGCPGDARVDFEAFLEATIVFARAAMHRLQARHKHHPQWTLWWDSLRGSATVEFFREERDCILKQASPKIGQKIFMPTIGGPDAYVPAAASEFYYFEDPETTATDTLEKHLIVLEKLLAEAETTFANRDRATRV